jgi:uncharacterized protein
MLKADLGLLAREHRVRIDGDLAPDDEVWGGTGIRFQGPVSLRLELQEVVSGDVVARGWLRGTVELTCRRCMRPVFHELDEELTLVFRPGLTPVEAEEAEIYLLPEKARELDLTAAVREHVMLSVPEYVNCTQTCRGFCPQCGTNLNESSCECTVEDEDPRWAALRRLRSE